MNGKMREELERLMERDDVSCVIGYEKGSCRFRVSPSFAFTAEDIQKIIFSPLCEQNLAVYLTLNERSSLPGDKTSERKKQVIILKGCDSRSLVQILVEKGISREDVIVLGVACTGIIDHKKIEAMFPDSNGDVVERGDRYMVIIPEGENREIPKEELLLEKCKRCQYPNPVICDILLGEKLEPKIDDFGDIEAFEKKELCDRWNYWKEHFERCIRCYACREACPLCYCEECLVEHLEPQWVRRSVELSENVSWNLLRAFHLAGRCVGCGECERACPVDIPLMELNRKMTKDVMALFAHTAGVDPDAKPMPSSFRPDDPDE